MNRARLAVLAAHLETVPREHFDMGGWTSHSWGFNSALEEAVSCGMTACAGGWACAIPEFKEAGLKMVHGSPEFQDRRSFQAMQLFFDIDQYTSGRLFGCGAHQEQDNPVLVSNQIYKLLSTGSV